LAAKDGRGKQHEHILSAVGEAHCDRLAEVTQLIVITGPIGAGKSVVANSLADRFAAADLSAVSVDLDDVVAMLRAPLDQLESSWDCARRIHGSLTAAWFRSGVDAVIAHGPFYTAAEIAAVVADLPGSAPRRVMLRVPFDVAFERVKDDPMRGLSKDPRFLRATHDRFCELLPSMPACEWDFDTTKIPVSGIVATLADAMIPNMDAC
jgi:shikimate kinase